MRVGLSGREWRLIAIGAVVGAVVGTLAPTSYQEPARASAFWNLARMGPVTGEQSLLMIALACVGGAIATLMVLRLSEGDRYVITATLVAFVAANSTNRVLFQRYYEPLVLIVLSLSASRILAATSEATMSNRAAWLLAIGPLTLGACQVLMTAWRVATPEVP